MSELKARHIEILGEYGVYIPTKTIELFGEITPELAANTINNIHAMDSYSGSINIKLNSQGGCVTSGWAIFDAIGGCKNYVRSTVYGQASSMGAIILQAADERIMTPHSILMLHIGELNLNDHAVNVDRWHEHFKNVDKKQMEDLLLEKIKHKRPRFSRKKLNELLIFDSIMTPKEALEYGLIDKIGEVQ